MSIRPRVTEEFLWGLYELLEGAADINRQFGVRSWKDVANPEWRNLRLAYEKKRSTKTFSQFVSYLKQKGYVKLPTGESVGPLQLTKTGKLKALKCRAKGTMWSNRKDGKMIMLMYDIPKKNSMSARRFAARWNFWGIQCFKRVFGYQGKMFWKKPSELCVITVLATVSACLS